LAEAIGGRAQIGVDLELGPTPPLPVEVKVALYRIAQESLNNVVKHAQAGRVEVRLEAGAETVVLRIHDDGLGFDSSDVPAGHFGLGNIRERAEAIGADAVIDSAPGCGTRITVTWRQDGK
jgi:signal transduction histidine kinase